MSTILGSVPFLRKDSVIDIHIGTEMVSRLQIALKELTADQDTVALRDRIAGGTATSSLDLAIIGISSLLSHIYTVAQQQGYTDMKELTIDDITG